MWRKCQNSCVGWVASLNWLSDSLQKWFVPFVNFHFQPHCTVWIRLLSTTVVMLFFFVAISNFCDTSTMYTWRVRIYWTADSIQIVNEANAQIAWMKRLAISFRVKLTELNCLQRDRIEYSLRGSLGVCLLPVRNEIVHGIDCLGLGVCIIFVECSWWWRFLEAKWTI